MTGVVLQIPSYEREFQPELRLDKCFGVALRDYCKRRWPHHTAKYAAREFDLSLEEGRGLAKASPSKRTIEKVFKRGGLAVALPIIEEVTGESLSGFLRALGRQHEKNDQRVRALLGDIRALHPLDRGFGGGVDVAEDNRRDARRRRVG